MAQIQNRAMLFNIGAFIADNNIRRSVAAFTYNYQSADGSVSHDTFTIQPAGSKTYTTNGNAVLFVHTTSPVVATVSLVDLTEPVVRTSSSYVTFIQQTHFIDDQVASVVFQNTGLVPLQITILKG